MRLQKTDNWHSFLTRSPHFNTQPANLYTDTWQYIETTVSYKASVKTKVTQHIIHQPLSPRYETSSKHVSSHPLATLDLMSQQCKQQPARHITELFQPPITVWLCHCPLSAGLSSSQTILPPHAVCVCVNLSDCVFNMCVYGALFPSVQPSRVRRNIKVADWNNWSGVIIHNLCQLFVSTEKHPEARGLTHPATQR